MRLLLLLSVGMLLSSCGRSGVEAEARRPSPRAAEAVPVVTAPVEIKTMPVLLSTVGTVEAISTVKVTAQITGQIRDVLFTPGADVQKGQALFRLDPRPFEAAVKQAAAVLARDQAQASDAQAQRTRLENLVRRGLIPRDQYESQVASVAALDATVAADRALVEQARLNLQYTRIDAPIAGRTGALLAYAGDVVRANDANALVTINQLSPIDVSFAVPARFLAEIRLRSARTPLAVAVSGPSARPPGSADETVPTPAAPAQRAARGEVTFIDNAVDPSTATVTLKATFPNRDRALWPGLFVQVALQLSLQPDAVVVPATAVQSSQQGPFVYVVKHDRTVELRKVVVDRQQGDAVVIASGLGRGEEVVTEGQLRLTPGAVVTTGNEDAPTS
jgi:multidrug efflux system membrane fusion protein